MWCLPGEAFSTHRTHIGLVDPSVMRANVVGHSVLSFKALLADRALKGLLIWMGKLVAIQVVDITEGLATHLTPMVFLDRFWRFFRDILLRQIAHCWSHDTCARRNRSGRRREDACYCGDVGWVAVVLSRHGCNHRYHGGSCLGCLLWTWHHLDTGVAGLMAS